ncbi:hypothetical protein V0U79_01405 [Hyphobacterium sp. HN65]|uniref:BPP domain-containing protein n=1 Tax=Hyphobacterium lacteum TaxID=3116575 RepID=A0ABU7LM45_9PROT|nr:hypothetical protein [Hyphobacterium sp. HN65]MEE2525005.1 hypothetical protein [Hyphobacterium sp. HN65]
MLLAACDPAQPDATGDTTSQLADDGYLEMVSTGVMEPVQTEGVSAVSFVPDTSTAWAGLVAVAPTEGGIDLFNADGESVHRMTGPRLWGLATAPGFQLRGEALPLLFGADRNTNLVRAFALLRDGPELIEAPIQPIGPQGDIASVCALGEGIGYVDLVVLSRGTSVEIWRVADDGGDLIGAERRARFDLPSPARSCVASDGAIYAASPAGGIFRFDEEGNVTAQIDGYASALAAGDFLGRPVLILSDGNSETLNVRDGTTLSPIGNVIVRDGFSIPGVDRPGALAATEASFGGASYQSGLVAIADEEDGRVRLVARETFARGITNVD